MTAQQIEIPGVQNLPSAWLGRDIGAEPERWTIRLSAAHIAELESNLSDDISLTDLTKSGFPLPTLGSVLREFQGELINGRGFGLIKGLDVTRFGEDQAARIFFGIGTHLGHARSQNAAGDILGHVRDVGARPDDPKSRIYQTSARQTFHTDSSDVVGLICLKDAKSGGESLLVSAGSIFNEMQKRRPDLLPLLFEPIATDRRGEVPDGMKPFFEIPVFTWHLGFLNVMYQRQYIDSAQRFAAALRLSDRHVAALDLFDELANDPDLCFSMRLAPGDMQFVYNHALLHDRTGFEDHADLADRRHLLRLWLSVPGDRPLPDCFAQRFGSTEIGNRGGIVVGA